MRARRKNLVWLGGAVKSPPFSAKARTWSGRLLRRLQEGELLSMPQSRPMPGVGERCHELRIPDEQCSWRIVCRLDPDAVLVADVFARTTEATPRRIIELCRWRLKRYDLRKKER